MNNLNTVRASSLNSIAGLLFSFTLTLLSISPAYAAAPNCEAAHASTPILWPANHKMVDIQINGLGDAEVVIQCIKQDEPLNTNGDGNTEFDAINGSASNFLVRAERQGGGNGRVYHVGYTASNAQGQCSGVVQVSVPPSKKKSVTDDGPLYVSIENAALCDTVAENLPPAFTSEPISQARIGDQYIYDVQANDPENDAISFSLAKAPESMVIDATSGLINWSPTESHLGEHNLEVIVTDSNGNSSNQIFILNVLEPINHSVVISSEPITQAIAEQLYTYQVVANDPDGDTLQYSLGSRPQGMTISSEGVVTWTPIREQAGSHNVRIDIDDGRGGFVSQLYVVSVPVSNSKPVISSKPAPQTVLASLYQYTVIASDPEGDTLSYSLILAPIGMSIDPTTGVVTWTSTVGQSGSHDVIIEVNDGQGGISTQSFTLTVIIPNHNPEVTSLPVTNASVAQGYFYQITAEDSDGDTLLFSLGASPTGMTINASSGAVAWLPTSSQVGEHKIIVNVSDNNNGIASQTFNIVVVQPNRAPEITSTPVKTVNENSLYYYQVTATDLDENTTLTYELIDAPQGMYIDSVTGLVEWLPNMWAIGSHNVTVKVSDNESLSVSQSFSLQVLNVNYAPSAENVNVSLAEDSPAEITLLGSDSDGDNLSYIIVTQPTSGVLTSLDAIQTYQPNDNFNGTDSFSYKVYDGSLYSATATVTITVTAVNDLPVAHEKTLEVDEGNSVVVVLSGFDTEQSSLTFNVTSQPSNGQLTGTAPNLVYQANANFIGTDSFTYKVNDGVIDSATALVTIRVNEVYEPPKITSQPNTVGVVAQLYQYDVDVEESSAVGLVYSLAIAPDNMEIDSETGLVSWTPTTEGQFEVSILVTNTIGLSTSQDYTIDVIYVEPNHEGTDFWLTFAQNYTGSQALMLYISGKEATTGVVTAASGGFRYEFTVVPGEITQVDLPNTFWTDYAKEVQAKGIHVSSEKNIVLYALNQKVYTTDGFLVMPTATLGKNYYAMTYDKGQITVVAPYDDTQVTFTFAVGSSVENTGDYTYYGAGEQKTISLNKGQSYSINNRIGTGTYAGSQITSTKPIATFTGNKCVNVPTSQPSCDHLVEQIPDVSYWGMEYSFIPLSLRYKGDTVRIVAAFDNTVIRINGEIISELNKGGFIDDIIADPSQISANHPILVAQFSHGASYDSYDRYLQGDNSNLGDPFMMLLTAERGFVKEYTFTTTQRNMQYNFANIAIAQNSASSLLLDGETVDTSSFTLIPNTSMLAGSIELNEGAHTISSDAPFGLYIYGFGDNESYGYQGGLKLPRLSNTTSLQVNGSSQSPQLGEELCFSITAATGQMIAPDSRVDFFVSGANSTAGHRFVDSTGQANFCYVATSAGQDTLKVIIGNIAQEFSVNWQAIAGSGETAPVILSTPIGDALVGEQYRYQINAYDADPGAILSFQLVEAPAGMTIDTDGVVSWSPLEADIGQADVVIQVFDNTGLSVTQSYALTTYQGNRAPIITRAASTHVAYVGQVYYEPMTFSDPDGDRVYCRIIGGGFISNTTNYRDCHIHKTLKDEHIGPQYFELKIHDRKGGEIIYRHDVLVKKNHPPEVEPLPLSYAKVGQPYNNQLNITDPDGDRLYHRLIGVRHIESDKNVTVSNISIGRLTGEINWTPDETQVGTYRFTVRTYDVIDTIDTSFDVYVSPANQAYEAHLAVAPQYPVIGQAVTIKASTKGAIGNVSYHLTVNGEVVELNANNEAIYTNTSITGSYLAVLDVTDSSEQVVTGQSTFYVNDGSDVTPPVADIISPDDAAKVTAPMDIVVTASDNNLSHWRLVLMSASNTTEMQEVASGQANVDNLNVYRFDPSMLTNGLYLLQLEVTDSSGQISYDGISLSVEGNLKVGNFTYTVDEFTYPMVGLPITVSRTYDSRRKHELLDFGYGWSLGYTGIKVEKSRQLGSGWALNEYKTGPGNILSKYCMEPLGKIVTTITLPNGDVEKFLVKAEIPCYDVIADFDVNLTFEPVGNTGSTLAFKSSSLVSLAGDGLKILGSDEIFDANDFILTTRAGFEYHFNTHTGMTFAKEPNGATLTFSQSGIQHSSGKSVTIARSGDNDLITQIRTPDNQYYYYDNDANNNLIQRRTPEGAKESYTYNSQHGLLKVLDSEDRTKVFNIYDDDGRLVAQEDAQGNRTSFQHDLAGRQSVVTDRLNRSTFFYYDDNGNVTSQVDALGGVTSYTFDDNNNQLSKTDALGRVTSATYNANDDQLSQTDALNNTVNFTYNDKGQELVITDESGDIFTNVYDTVGNLLSITDPQGIIVGNNINSKGLPILLRDGLGNETHYTYDDEGHKLTETDALGHLSSYTYDDNGNMLTQTMSRTVESSAVAETTTYGYDLRNRVISTTNALGETNTVEFDVIGNQSATVDAAGKRTTYQYDVYGRLLNTTYPDGTVSSSTYDKEGNVLTETDRIGAVTQFEYDALNRVVKTTYPDLTSMESEYDAVGQVTAEIDANGNRTEYSYDANGRRAQTTDALGNIHQFTYDVGGNLKTETDALGRTSTYVYDSLDRKTQTVMHNSSVIKTGFDALSRRVSATDQANITTQYGYDALGRLTSVTDVEGNTTQYTYDEAGNKLTQTDAENRTTSWTYDALGRVLTRTLPLGQVERFTYDVSGNMLTRTDFIGELTTYAYDINNRVTSITYSKDGSNENFTFDNNGNRLTATNSEGTWVYTYDVMSRLTTETKPNGEVLSYGYDNNGNKTTLTITYVNGDTRIETSTFDTLNRLSTVTDATGKVTTYTYNAVGNRASVTNSNTTSTHYVYDDLNRLTQMQHKQADETVLQQFDYTLDVTGRRTQLLELSGRVSDYSFDSLYRLETETITDAVNGDHSASYTFDKVGNRTQSVINGVITAFTYDNNDRLSQTGGESYTYDDNGSTLTKAIDVDITTYRYNAKNKLTTASITQGTVTTEHSYQYNVDGIRTQKIENGTATNFLVDNNQQYAQVIAETDNTNVPKVEYVFGDDLLSQKRDATTSTYLYDGLGSTRALTDESGNLSDEYFYDAFGVDLGKTGITDNDYLYTGEQFDAGLGNYYLRARYYNQKIGRFSQQDTWMGNSLDPVTLHKYLYANANPVSYVDPTGKFSMGSVMSAVNVMNTLVTTAQTVHDVFSFATGDGEVSAMQIGSGIILGMLPGTSGLKMLRMSNLKKKVNGNSRKSSKPQHLYKIDDKFDFDIYKFGISGVGLNKNGSSKRANTQANKLNRPLKFKRYIPIVIYRNIPGRIAALAVEKAMVCAYNKRKGRNPVGNKRPTCN